MIKVKTIGQMLPFKSGKALPSPAQAHGCVPGKMTHVSDKVQTQPDGGEG